MFLFEEIEKIVLSLNDKRMQSIYSIETYAHGTNKVLVSEKEEMKCNNIINDTQPKILMMLQKKT